MFNVLQIHLHTLTKKKKNQKKPEKFYKLVPLLPSPK